MPKVTINFAIPEEQDEMTLALKGSALWATLWDIDQFLRSLIEKGAYGIDEFTVKKIQEELYDTMAKHGVSIDMVE